MVVHKGVAKIHEEGNAHNGNPNQRESKGDGNILWYVSSPSRYTEVNKQVSIQA
jgi:hypothetical protein